MPSGRRRKPLRRRVRLQRWGALAAAALSAAAVMPVAGALEAPDTPAHSTAGRSTVAAERAAPRTASRDFVRPEAPAARMADVDRLAAAGTRLAVRHLAGSPPELSPRWVTAGLNVWSDPSERSRRLTVLDAGGRVQVTGVVRGAWAQISRDGRLGWVHRAYLSATKRATRPAFAAAGGRVSGAPCPDGSSVENGLVPHTVEVFRAVCAAFPAVTTWGGRSGDGGDHGSGHALDIMCSGSLGDAIAAYVRAHAAELGVSYLIWSQHIWSVERAGEGWRAMPDRGSTTANHYDHVHVTVF